MSTTPTGVPIIDCDTCDHRHPVSREHCAECGLAHIFPCDTEPAPEPIPGQTDLLEMLGGVG